MSTMALSIGGETVTTKLAMRMEDSLQAFAVRAACFIGELDVPYSEEFDGHDFGATHIIAYVGDEPVGHAQGALVPVLRHARAAGGTSSASAATISGSSCSSAARKLAESRGCNMLYAQVLPADVKYWEKQGWRRLVAEDAQLGRQAHRGRRAGGRSQQASAGSRSAGIGRAAPRRPARCVGPAAGNCFQLTPSAFRLAGSAGRNVPWVSKIPWPPKG